MKKHDESLFQIGEVIKILGVTRKTLLVYEEAGLLMPAVKDEESGYRYYSADNMTQIRSIRSLQVLGLTLKEIAEYYYDTDHMDRFLDRLIELRTALDRNIQMLQVRAVKPGDTTVHHITLPRQVCYCRRYLCENIADATNRLRDTYVAAARSEKMSMLGRMFSQRMSAATDKLDLLFCIPVEDSFEGPERVDFPEAPAICVYHRGSYEDMLTASQALVAYMKEHHLRPAGPFRSIYLEGPPNRGGNNSDYITQIAVPVAKVE